MPLAAFLVSNTAYEPPSTLRFAEGFWHAPDVAVSYPDQGHAGLPNDPANWWYAHRAALVVQALGRPAGNSASTVWDIGGGTGLMDPAIREAGWRVVLVEPVPAAARVGLSRADVVVAGTLEQLELPDASVQTVGLFDVIEHLDDPVALLTECRRVLVPGGRAIVTVPAYPWLWSSTDVAAGHKRRYTKREMRLEATAAGLSVLRQERLFALLVLPAIPSRLIRLGRGKDNEQAALGRASRALNPSAGTERVLNAALRVERLCSRVVPMPIGLSLLAVLARPAAPR